MAGFLSFNMSKANRVIKLIFCIHLLKLQLDDMILDGCGQACPKRLLKLSGGPVSCDLLSFVFGLTSNCIL